MSVVGRHLQAIGFGEMEDCGVSAFSRGKHTLVDVSGCLAMEGPGRSALFCASCLMNAKHSPGQKTFHESGIPADPGGVWVISNDLPSLGESIGESQ